LASEAPNFESGASPLAPNTPYDLFSSTPQVSGNAGIGSITSIASYCSEAFDFSVSAGFENVRGSVTNAAHLGENLMPTLNPHLGSQALPYAVSFPTHPGQDDGTATRLSILSGRIATADGNLSLRAGWFDLGQTGRFVFAQPNLTSLNPAIAYAPPETLSSGLAGPGSTVGSPFRARCRCKASTSSPSTASRRWRQRMAPCRRNRATPRACSWDRSSSITVRERAFPPRCCTRRLPELLLQRLCRSVQIPLSRCIRRASSARAP
jgi:hypothetical protein